MRETSTLHINLAAIAHNISVVRDVVGRDVAICPVVKADGYGLGVRGITKSLIESSKKDATTGAMNRTMLAVYSPRQAAALTIVLHEIRRANMAKTPILILMPCDDSICDTQDWPPGLLDHLQGDLLHFTIHHADNLQPLRALARQHRCCIPAHVEVDTGLSRGGLVPELARQVINTIQRDRAFRLAGVFSHFSNPRDDEPRSDWQHSQLEALVASLDHKLPPDCCVHMASTRGVFASRNYHMQMVRIGLAWCGFGSEKSHPDLIRKSLQPIARWTTKIVHTRDLPAGADVGYNSLYRCSRASRLAVVPIGYADGWPSSLCEIHDREAPRVGVFVDGVGNDGLHRRVLCPVIGRVNMDQIMLDITDLPRNRVGNGSIVELLSDKPVGENALPTLAKAAGIVEHEFLTSIGPRVQRRYISQRVAREVTRSHTVTGEVKNISQHPLIS